MTQNTVNKNRHKHKCPKCSFLWEHEDTCVNNTKAHTCQKCGTVQWFWDYYPNETGTFISCANMPMDRIPPKPYWDEFLSILGGKFNPPICGGRGNK